MHLIANPMHLERECAISQCETHQFIDYCTSPKYRPSLFLAPPPAIIRTVEVCRLSMFIIFQT